MNQAMISKTSDASDGMLWQPCPERIAATQLYRFKEQLAAEYKTNFPDYAALWQFSVQNREAFWSAVWDFCGVIGNKGNAVLENGDQMPGTKFFPQANLNFAENLLRRSDNHPAITFWGEEKQRLSLSFAELRQQVAAIAAFLRQSGIKSGDRVAAYVPNMPQTIVCMLAASSIGAVWSSCSPDFGVQGVLDRFGQIAPRVFIVADGYFYKGQPIDCLAKTEEILKALPSVEQVIVIPYTAEKPDLSAFPQARLFTRLIQEFLESELQFDRLPFNHPLYIMFSSGTTGVPKCIVHGAGGTLIQHLKEHRLHCDIRRDDRVFYYTTCGWMMWNWMVSALASEATLLLFDGFPFQRRGAIILDMLAQEKATLFGTSAKYIDAINKLHLNPAATHDLANLRLVASTGSPLSPEGFDYVYSHIKADVQLASISGGTDIISCFVLGSPINPVYRGEIQVAGLGMDVAIADEEGNIVMQEKGELICRKSFPSMPIGFWNDADGKKYHAAYFDRFPNIWCHGDYAEQTAQGGFIIYGRSDATLNPGGVRIGTAEIYRQVEQLEEVVEGLVIGQEWDNDVRVVLFVKLREGLTLDDGLRKKITNQIRTHASPRHVPAKIIQVADIPRTKSGKIVELAVREMVHNRPVKNKEALANPEALELFKNLPELLC